MRAIPKCTACHANVLTVAVIKPTLKRDVAIAELRTLQFWHVPLFGKQTLETTVAVINIEVDISPPRRAPYGNATTSATI